MAKLKLPSLKERKGDTFTAPENHTNSRSVIDQLQKGLKDGVFKGLSLDENGQTSS